MHRSQYSTAYILQNLGHIQDHPYRSSNLGPVLKHVQNIKATILAPKNVTKVNVQVNACFMYHPSYWRVVVYAVANLT